MLSRQSPLVSLSTPPTRKAQAARRLSKGARVFTALFLLVGLTAIAQIYHASDLIGEVQATKPAPLVLVEAQSDQELPTTQLETQASAPTEPSQAQPQKKEEQVPEAPRGNLRHEEEPHQPPQPTQTHQPTQPPPPPPPPQPTQPPQTLREFYKRRSSQLNEDQQQAVAMMKHAWVAYDTYGQHSDMLDTQLRRGVAFANHDVAFTLVDSLDTLFIMGLHDEFDNASAWMKTNLRERILQPGTLNFFETTIRSLGGLLSAYYLSGEAHILELADTLGSGLSKAFAGGRVVPYQNIDLLTGEGSDVPCLSEASSFQLEFTYMSKATDKQEYLEYVHTTNSLMANLTRDFFPDGLIPVRMNWEAPSAQSTQDVSFAALADSHFEYLLKQWLLTGKKDDVMKQRYLDVVEGMKQRLVGHSSPSNLTFIGILPSIGTLEERMEHLACFVPGMLALGTFHGLPDDHLELAKALMETCVAMYMRSKTLLAPESVNFRKAKKVDDEMFVLYHQDHNLQRPETVESLMILYRVTKDTKYRDYGRTIMKAFEEHSKVASGGYKSLRNPFYGPVSLYSSKMESFFLAETLKYLYLLFSDDDILPLDAVVFNTEAHPFPVLTE